MTPFLYFNVQMKCLNFRCTYCNIHPKIFVKINLKLLNNQTVKITDNLIKI